MSLRGVWQLPEDKAIPLHTRKIASLPLVARNDREKLKRFPYLKQQIFVVVALRKRSVSKKVQE